MKVIPMRRRTTEADVPAETDPLMLRQQLVNAIQSARLGHSKKLPALLDAAAEADEAVAAVEKELAAARSLQQIAHHAIAALNLETETAIQQAEARLRESADPRIAAMIQALRRRDREICSAAPILGVEFAGRKDGQPVWVPIPNAVTSAQSVADIRSAVKSIEALAYEALDAAALGDRIDDILATVRAPRGRPQI
jgi:hypothetical protein